MKTVVLKVKNVRLSNLETNVHVVGQNLTTDTSNKRILGQIQSFKTEKVVDAFNENGQLVAAQTTPFIIENIDFSKNIIEVVSDYIDENLATLVAR